MLLGLNNSCSPDAQYGDLEEQLKKFQGNGPGNSAEETDIVHLLVVVVVVSN